MDSFRAQNFQSDSCQKGRILHHMGSTTPASRDSSSGSYGTHNRPTPLTSSCWNETFKFVAAENPLSVASKLECCVLQAKSAGLDKVSLIMFAIGMEEANWQQPRKQSMHKTIAVPSSRPELAACQCLSENVLALALRAPIEIAVGKVIGDLFEIMGPSGAILSRAWMLGNRISRSFMGGFSNFGYVPCFLQEISMDYQQ